MLTGLHVMWFQWKNLWGKPPETTSKQIILENTCGWVQYLNRGRCLSAPMAESSNREKGGLRKKPSALPPSNSEWTCAGDSLKKEWATLGVLSLWVTFEMFRLWTDVMVTAMMITAAVLGWGWFSVFYDGLGFRSIVREAERFVSCCGLDCTPMLVLLVVA